MSQRMIETRRPRVRRKRVDLREALLQSALIEFGAKGFDGASTSAIAQRVQAHQPQINYYFQSKDVLWTTAVDYLFGLLNSQMRDVFPVHPREVPTSELGLSFADAIRRLVRFVAAHPELNQIMVHEGTADSDRLTWVTETHVRDLFASVQPIWNSLREAGVAAPIESDLVYYILVGAASLPYVNAPEVRLLTGRDPTDVDWIETHADALVGLLLPGLATVSGGGAPVRSAPINPT
jgi:TetR/AcrR family transcriptional regulator